MAKILIDAYSTDLPEDVVKPSGLSKERRELFAGTDALRSKDDSSRSAPVLLDRWDIETHVYQRNTAGKVGFLTGLFSSKHKSKIAGVVHEAKRYRIEETPTGREVEIGVSVRLSVATASFSTEVSLSIPNLAAQAQLDMSDARIGISVVGYGGPIGDLLPAPDDLNVENFSTFTSAVEEIQKRVFGPDGVAYLLPTKLAYNDPDEDADDANA